MRNINDGYFQRPMIMSMAAAGLVLLALSACGDTVSEPQVNKGDRILAIKANVGLSGDFDEVFKESVAAGSETQVVPLDWRDIETSPGVFEPATNFLAIANSYYTQHEQPIHLAIRPIHTNQKVVPTDLTNRALDDPRTVERFKRLLDWVALQVPDVELTSIVIGSEIDIYLWGSDERWEEWTRFYAAVTPYARTVFPGTLISSESTHAAFSGPDLARLQRLHQYSDAVGVSYYPMQNGLRGAKSPESVHADFANAVSAVPGKPIIYYQIGYPSSELLESSPEQQAEFIREMFRAWDKHADRILMLNIQWMHEAPDFGVDYFAKYYQNDSPDFRAFLGSLGLKSWEGEPKPAWEAVVEAATAREFGTP